MTNETRKYYIDFKFECYEDDLNRSLTYYKEHKDEMSFIQYMHWCEKAREGVVEITSYAYLIDVITLEEKEEYWERAYDICHKFIYEQI